MTRPDLHAHFLAIVAKATEAYRQEAHPPVREIERGGRPSGKWTKTPKEPQPYYRAELERD